MTTINNAISAYRDAAMRATQAEKPAETASAKGPSFGNLVKDALTQAVDTVKTSEKVSTAGILGKADITEVAQAVNNADLTLQSVVAVRDKVITAYQQILNMPI